MPKKLPKNITGSGQFFDENETGGQLHDTTVIIDSRIVSSEGDDDLKKLHARTNNGFDENTPYNGVDFLRGKNYQEKNQLADQTSNKTQYTRLTSQDDIALCRRHQRSGVYISEREDCSRVGKEHQQRRPRAVTDLDIQEFRIQDYSREDSSDHNPAPSNSKQKKFLGIFSWSEQNLRLDNCINLNNCLVKNVE